MFDSIYRTVQNLSLDIVAGAVILLRFFSSQLSIEIPLVVYVLLGCSVWLIYTIDHVKDSKRAQVGDRARYKFHLHHAKALYIVAILLFLICFSSAFLLTRELLFAGSLLFLLSGLYLGIHRFLAKWGLKEGYIALIYTCGILVSPFTIAERIEWDLFWLLFLLTLSNLMLFSMFEKEEDKADGFDSIATVVHPQKVDRIIFSCISVGITTILLGELSLLKGYFLLAFALYVGLFSNQRWAKSRSRYRILGDGVFLLPILMEWG